MPALDIYFIAGYFGNHPVGRVRGRRSHLLGFIVVFLRSHLLSMQPPRRLFMHRGDLQFGAGGQKRRSPLAPACEIAGGSNDPPSLIAIHEFAKVPRPASARSFRPGARRRG